MLQFITKLQRKPEGAKKRIALVASAAATGIVIFFWLANIVAREPSREVVHTEDDIGPFRALAEGVEALITDVTDTARSAASVFSSFTSSGSEETREPSSE